MRGSYGRAAGASLARAAALAAALLALACEPAQEKPAATPAVDETLDVLVPELVDAVQAKQPLFVMDHVAESFSAPRGLDYHGVRALVEGYAFRDEEVGARLESVAITPGENGAQHVAARVAFSLGTRLAPGGPLPPGAVVYALDLVFVRRDGRWLAQSATYRRE